MGTAPAAATTTRTEAMADRAPAAAPTSAATLLQLMWLASPALPVGAFSYSEGLEAAVEAGLLADEAAVARWLVDQLHLSVVRSELAIVVAALAAWRCGDLATVAELNDWVTQTRETHELCRQTQQTGRSLAAWLSQRGPVDARVAALAALSPAPTWPVAFALAAAQTAASAQETGLSFAFAWAENQVQAAVKAVPLGQSAGQRVLAALVEALPSAVEQALQQSPHARQAFTPMLAILSSQHEAQYSRLFRS